MIETNPLRLARNLVSVLPVMSSPILGYQNFHQVPLVTQPEKQFSLSLQGSDAHFCYPRMCLPYLGMYDSVEVSFHGESTGFSKVRSYKSLNNVFTYVPLDVVINDLAEFFRDGGKIDISRSHDLREGLAAKAVW